MKGMKEKNGVFILAARLSDLGNGPTSSAVTARGTWFPQGAVPQLLFSSSTCTNS